MKIPDLQLIAFDADDTLWANEPLFRGAEARVGEIVSEFCDIGTFRRELYQTEVSNMDDFGYGAKAFTLSMIQTASRLAGDSLRARHVEAIIEVGRSVLRNPAVPLPGVKEVLDGLRGRYRLAVFTKGEPKDQLSKLARSGLRDRFEIVEVLMEKDASIYMGLLERYGISPERFLMVGNSFKSDIAPVLDIGGWAAQVPCDDLWELERLSDYPHRRRIVLESITGLLDFL